MWPLRLLLGATASGGASCEAVIVAEEEHLVAFVPAAVLQGAPSIEVPGQTDDGDPVPIAIQGGYIQLPVRNYAELQAPTQKMSRTISTRKALLLLPWRTCS